MNIPGDFGSPWRYQKLIEYISKFPDEIGPVIREYLNKRGANNSDKVWWVLLYSTCYCATSACVMYEKLNYRVLDKKSLKNFWADNKSKLIFQSDRRYIKNMNQFVPIINEFMKKSKRNPWKYISQFVKDTPESTYNALYKEVGSWKYYGRFSIILFMYNLNKILGIPMKSEKYDWKNGSTTTSAIFNARYMDDKAELFENNGKLSNEDINLLDKSLIKIMNVLNKKYPDKNWTIMGVTSDLCSYRKMFKRTRYLGFYVDRQQEELSEIEKDYPELKSMFKELWNYRKAFIPHEFLGEMNGWDGIQKHRMNAWTEKGEFR